MDRWVGGGGRWEGVRGWGVAVGVEVEAEADMCIHTHIISFGRLRDRRSRL